MDAKTVIKLYESLKEILGQETAELLLLFIEEKIKEEINKINKLHPGA
jgi:hypothetical protein